MILRAAIVFLLVLNIGVGAWWVAGGDAAPVSAAGALPPGLPGLQLVSEAAAAKPRPLPAATDGGEGRAGPPADAAASASAKGTQPGTAAPQQPVAAVQQCLRFGPFADADAREAARRALAAAGVDARAYDSPARSGRGWKVYLPPFPSREEARAAAERIKAAGVTDWYLMGEGADANSIAMGRFGGEEGARRRLAELAAKGIQARAEPVGETKAQAWLEARAPAASRVALARIAPVREIGCPADARGG